MQFAVRKTPFWMDTAKPMIEIYRVLHLSRREARWERIEEPSAIESLVLKADSPAEGRPAVRPYRRTQSRLSGAVRKQSLIQITTRHHPLPD